MPGPLSMLDFIVREKSESPRGDLRLPSPKMCDVTPHHPRHLVYDHRYKISGRQGPHYYGVEHQKFLM
jgi:hypothetical protein